MEKKISLNNSLLIILSLIIVGTLIGGAVSGKYNLMNRTTRNINNQELPEMIVVQISIDHLSVLSHLIDNDITIIDRQDLEIKVYVNQEQLKWLHETGFDPKIAYGDPLMINWSENPEFLQFHSYSTLTTELQNIAANYPNLTRLYDLGHSVQGRVIWGLKITDNPEVEENEPEVRICGCHHGNELMSVELPLLLAQYLTNNYDSDPYIEDLVNNLEIWIIPMVNPDGREVTSRYNANGVDLNRDYGYMWDGSGYSPSPFSQPETQAIRNHALENNFVLSLSYHTTAAYVNYVWNYKGQETPDHPFISSISEDYAALTGYIPVLGYDWYQVRGDTNDFSYGCRGDLDTTIETANSGITTVWNLNRDAMLGYIDAADIGLTGIVTDSLTGVPINATIWVEEAYWPCFTDPIVGDYHKVLLSGNYTVHFRANGYEEKVFAVELSPSNESTVLNVSLNSSNNFYAYQVTWVNFYDPFSYPQNFRNNPTEAISALGPQDGMYASLGVGGTIVLDMGQEGEFYNGTGPDFTVYEGDLTSEGYHVTVSETWDGPWISVGSDMGTASFDLENGGVERARYIKIQDDYGGDQWEKDPGFDLDAIQILHPVQELKVLLDGYCNYTSNPANNVTLEIINLDTDRKWQVDTFNNYYSLILTSGEDINISETLRFIARDNTSYVNITDHLITPTDINSRSIHLDLILDEYYLDLTDFPMYEAENNNPIYTVNQLTGSAVAQMNLDYMWWNSSVDPGEPPTWSENNGWNQSNLYNYGQENNSNTSLPFMDATGMWHTIQTLDPEPYLEYGYNFGIYNNVDVDYMLSRICLWIDYPAGTKPGHPEHVPGAVPTFEDYSRWMSIRGIHTNTSAYPLPSALDVYGFWVNDPYPAGIGENTYKTSADWTGTYYRPINVVDDPYNGEYVAICEPPLPDEECDLTLVPSPERWDPLDEPPGSRKGGMAAFFLRQVSDNTVVNAAIDGVTDQLIPYDSDFEAVFRQSYPGRPILIKNLVEEKGDYYAVPFTNVPTLQPIPRDSHEETEEEITLIVVLVDANDGHFKEASWVDEPVKYLPISNADALELVFDELEGIGINPEDLNAREIKTDLVYRELSPFHPDWRVIINELELTFFVNQDGTLSA